MRQEERIVGATVAGKYRVRRVVGAGSMGLVCEAVHLEIGKRLAIKMIDASLAGMGDIALRFRQEARAASLVESQHIVQVFDVGDDDQLGLYLVMEYLTGEDLAKTLSRETRLASDVAVRIAVQAARGLAKAHEAGVVHRDLKPANIFLVEREDEEPLVKILDFGISKVVEASRGSAPGLKLTRAGMVIGTPQYMSPEQAQGYAVDERTDVWALGLVLYEMLSGRPGYPELATYEQFIVHLVSHPPDPLREVAPWVPVELARVVHEALEHDIHRRIPNCNELVRRLLKAHPPAPFRPSTADDAESADTWTDGPVTGARRHGYGQPSHPVGNEPSPSRTLIASQWPTDDRPPEEAEEPAPGARAVVPDERGDEDAPQFFDRRSLLRAGSPLSLALASEAVATKAEPGAKSLWPAGTTPRFLWTMCAFVALLLAVAVALH